jgi:hypothetical protein
MKVTIDLQASHTLHMNNLNEFPLYFFIFYVKYFLVYILCYDFCCILWSFLLSLDPENIM